MPDIITDPQNGSRLAVMRQEEGLVVFQLGGALAAVTDLDSLSATPGVCIRSGSSRWWRLHKRAAAKLILDGMDKLGFHVTDFAHRRMLKNWLKQPLFVGGWKVQPVGEPEWSEVESRPVDGVGPFQLRDYQVSGCRWAFRSQLNGLLGDEMGLGKTVQVGATLESFRGFRRFAVVVTTKSTLFNWVSELERWAPSWTAVAIPSSSRLKKVVTNPCRPDVLVITWGLLPRVLEDLQGLHPDTLIADEAHYLAAGYKTKRGRAFMALSSMCTSSMLMTGTPLINRPADLWPLLHVIDPVRFTLFGDFGSAFCDPQKVLVKGGRRVLTFTGSSDSEGLAQLLSGYQFRRLKADVLSELPDRVEFDVRVAVKASTKKLWRDTLKSIRSSDTLDGSVLSGVGESWHQVGRDKAGAAAEYILDLVDAGEGPVIALIFHSDVCVELVEKLRTKGLRVAVIVGDTPAKRRDVLVERFQSGDFDVMVGSTALREGVTLTRSRHVVQVEYWWTEAAMDQGASRAHRFGQSRDVLVHFIHGVGSIDEHIKRVVRKKRAMRESIVERATSMRAFVEGVKELEE